MKVDDGYRHRLGVRDVAVSRCKRDAFEYLASVRFSVSKLERSKRSTIPRQGSQGR